MANTTMSPVTFLVVLLLLTSPLVLSNRPYFPVLAKTTVKTAFFVSTLPLLFMLSQENEAIGGQKAWANSFFSTSFNFYLDTYAIMFLPVALFVTWSILEYSLWYMNEDNKKRFIKYLLIFLLTMIILITAGNFLIFFIGWEGVGLMSFLLIGWFHGRNNAAVAASQAVLYNRFGDIGFLMTFCWFLTMISSAEILATAPLTPPTFILFATILAAATKSAQFFLHPWLASAMEGPTPVSALLHSSTMVVAGIFLLLRLFPIIEKNQHALTACLCLGALTTFGGAWMALTQNDVKKIVAYSTSSQLGLMMVAIGIGQPHLAFLHICTHAFFKALLFMCSGMIIHNLDGEQDLRKMGGLQLVMPVTTSYFSIGSLALMGMPFLAGFYSKDAIIEAANISVINAMALLLTIIATTFTAVYSLRLVYYITIKFPRINPVLNFAEKSVPALKSLTRLVLGSIVAGLIFFNMIFPHTPATHTMTPLMKILALAVSFLGLIIARDLAETKWNLPPSKVPQFKLYNPFFYNEVMHRSSIKIILNIAWVFVVHYIDNLVYKKYGASSLTANNLKPSQILRASQTGLIKAYLSTFFVTLVFVFICVTIYMHICF